MFSYQIGEALYLNITNQCTNRCDFCVRNTTDGLGGGSLWLDSEPTAQEVLATIDNPRKYHEIVFCGFGEPLSRVDVVVEIAQYLKPFGVPLRINTNGQANLIHDENIVPRLAGLIDVISISLNAESAEKYQELCHSDYGLGAYAAVLEFARECKKVIPKVVLSVVDRPEIDLAACRRITEELGVELKIRHWNPEL